MYAVVRIGGRQYTAEVGKTIVTEKLPYEVGEEVDFDEVLLISGDGETKVGQPTVDGASMRAKVVDQFRGKKIIVFHYRPKKRYRKKQGHRQYYTRLQVQDITG
ncbi:MAG: 50S ribosomal protein L21 [Chloroflexi bacterium]|nr:50S ribosomal protein L21 [Chloroflexota bacterium]